MTYQPSAILTASAASELPCPGRGLARWMLANHRDVPWVSDRLFIDRRAVRRLLAGERPVDETLALRLEFLTSVPFALWLSGEELRLESKSQRKTVSQL